MNCTKIVHNMEPQSSFEIRSDTPHLLGDEEHTRLLKQIPADDFKKERLRREVRKNWDRFYLRNGDRFFKDRQWTREEIFQMCSHINLKERLVCLEAGCGVGNSLFPLKQHFPKWDFYGFDFSSRAIQLLRERMQSICVNVETAVADITDVHFSLDFPPADIATMIFVLSAIPPEKRKTAVRNLKSMLKLGAAVIIRDYGVNDYAMIRFGRECKLSERLYARQDGTMTYYFKIEEMDEMFLSEGFRKEKSTYLLRQTVNHQKGIAVNRVFVQAVYVKQC